MQNRPKAPKESCGVCGHGQHEANRKGSCTTCDHCGYEFCEECGERAVGTPSGYISCPLGHGKLKTGFAGKVMGHVDSPFRVKRGITQKQLNKPLTAKERQYIEVVSCSDDDKGLPVYIARAINSPVPAAPAPTKRRPTVAVASVPALSPDVLAAINAMVAAEVNRQTGRVA